MSPVVAKRADELQPGWIKVINGREYRILSVERKIAYHTDGPREYMAFHVITPYSPPTVVIDSDWPYTMVNCRTFDL